MVTQTRKGEVVKISISSTIPIYNIQWSIQKGDLATVQPELDLMSAEVRDFGYDEFIQINVSGFKTPHKTLPFSETFTIIENSQEVQLR